MQINKIPTSLPMDENAKKLYENRAVFPSSRNECDYKDPLTV